MASQRPSDAFSQTGPETFLAASIQEIVADYVRNVRPVLEADMHYHVGHSSWKEALRAVASWRDAEGELYARQSHCTEAVLEATGRALREGEYAELYSFEDLRARIEGWFKTVPGAGPQLSYDAAVRMGAYLGLLPDKVYLRCGAGEGAEALGVNVRKTVSKKQFASDFPDFEPWEIEHCLYLYRGAFKGLHRPAA